MTTYTKSETKQFAAVDALLSALYQKHKCTETHSLAVENYALSLAMKMNHGWSVEELQHFGMGARMHDIGKLKTEIATLDYPSKLSSNQIQEIKNHPTIGERILRGSGMDFQQVVYDAVLYHHESFDGQNGYPSGLQGTQIPLAGRIVAVADMYDALISQRSYKQALSVDEAVKILNSEAGKKLDPLLTKLFITHVINSAV